MNYGPVVFLGVVVMCGAAFILGIAYDGWLHARRVVEEATRFQQERGR